MKTPSTILCTVLAGISLLASCTSGSVELRSNTPICEYLYGVEYDDYDFEAGMQVTSELYMPQAACSEVRKGNFVGRNFDWYINSDASFVIKVNRGDARYASIGMGGCMPPFTDSLASSGCWSPVYDLLPLMTMDGINEKGLYVGINVMPTGETSSDPDRWAPGQWGLGAAFTNPDAARTYGVSALVRFVLDNAASLAEARDLVESVNWYEPVDFPNPGESQAFHWLIADSVSNAVLEFIDNKPCFIQTDAVREPSYATIMTNFTNKLMADGQIVQPSGCGYERWEILRDNYAATDESADGMKQLMQKVWYTRTYTDSLDEHFMFTEFAGRDFPATEMYHNPDYKDNAAYAAFIKEQRALFADKAFWHVEDSPLWFTTHSVVYDLKRRSLTVMTHEGLDGQKEYYSASLSESNYAKPQEAE